MKHFVEHANAALRTPHILARRSQVWRSVDYMFSSSLSAISSLYLVPFTGVDFKMKTLLIDGIKVRIQIW